MVGMISRSVAVSLALLWLVVASSVELYVVGAPKGDVPSLYNMGPGGITELVSYVTLFKRVKLVVGVEELRQYEPRTSVLLVAGLEKSLSDTEISELLRWVSEGGKLVVADEYLVPLRLLQVLNVSLGPASYSIDLGRCTIGGRDFDVLFNVYREVVGGRTLCWVGGVPVAAEVALGRGTVLVFGDSSIAINEVLRSRYRPTQLAFLLEVLDRDTVAVFEGGRLRQRLGGPVGYVTTVIGYLAKFLAYVAAPGTPHDFLRLLVISVAVTAIAAPRPRLEVPRRRRGGVPAAGTPTDKMFSEAVAAWVRWVEDLGRGA